MPSAFLAVSVAGALFTLNALRPLRFRLVLVPAFFAAWLTNELPVHHLVWQAVATVVFVVAGALDGWQGWLGLAITLGSWAGLGVLARRGARADRIVDAAVDDSLGAAWRATLHDRYSDASAFPLGRVVRPFPLRDRRLERRHNITFAEVDGKPLRLDVHRSRAATGPQLTSQSSRAPLTRAPPADCEARPVVLYLHGGGWVLGFRDRQGLPLLQHLAAHGWLCISAGYRLSPGATFPDHLLDVKQAIAWTRAHAAEYGGDPSFIAIVGNSAGGHLAALAALTPNDPEYQPGFEDADTSLQACVPFYGIYDFANRSGAWNHDGMVRFLERVVMKRKLADDPEAFDRASPVARVRADAPPFFVIHGTADTLAPVGEARAFVSRLRGVAREPVVYAELPGAQHAFDTFPSLRTARVVGAVERFLAWVASRHVTAVSDAPR